MKILTACVVALLLAIALVAYQNYQANAEASRIAQAEADRKAAEDEAFRQFAKRRETSPSTYKGR